jgi:hypothetical protein
MQEGLEKTSAGIVNVFILVASSTEANFKLLCSCVLQLVSMLTLDEACALTIAQSHCDNVYFQCFQETNTTQLHSFVQEMKFLQGTISEGVLNKLREFERNRVVFLLTDKAVSEIALSIADQMQKEGTTVIFLQQTVASPQFTLLCNNLEQIKEVFAAGTTKAPASIYNSTTSMENKNDKCQESDRDALRRRKVETLEKIATSLERIANTSESSKMHPSPNPQSPPAVRRVDGRNSSVNYHLGSAENTSVTISNPQSSRPCQTFPAIQQLPLYYHLHPAQDLAFIIEFIKAKFPRAQELKTFPFPYEQLKPKPKPCQLVIFIDVNARMDTSMWEQMEEDLLKFAKPCIFVRVHNVSSTSHSFDQPPPHFMEKFCWCKTPYLIELDPTGMGENKPKLLDSRKLANDINQFLSQTQRKCY